MIHLKYEFASEKEANELILELENQDKRTRESKIKAVAIVKLGFLTIIPPEYNDKGEEIKPGVVSKFYSVDVLWETIEHPDWKNYRIALGKKPNSHNFAGSTYNESL